MFSFSFQSSCLCHQRLLLQIFPVVREEAKDFLLAQYEKVHRVRNKWKIGFKDAVLHFNGKEYVFDKVVGELDRDW